MDLLSPQKRYAYSSVSFTCKKRAELREMLLTYGKHGFLVNDTGKNVAWDKMKCRVLRVNRKALFQSFWDNAAIGQKPLVSDKDVDGPQAPMESDQAVQ
ncbi:hypothetical protein PsorP6_003932 [Peronosclerospora sorghi]|uniref:Uncharacterized protein n=1 Tax=Peronosclerospora sorghi TaxID=230839 RepID=A0ACC0VKS8_9STRA|nr:hypothetical protein PsorP6_003932 [Peronosclerospora sorghi]